jgi:hypothetical protein
MSGWPSTFATMTSIPAEHHLIFGAVEDKDDEALFVTGNSTEWYGQYVVERPEDRFDGYANADVKRVPTFSIRSLLSRFERVDYMDLDIQMSELRAIPAGIDEMTKKCGACLSRHMGTKSMRLCSEPSKLMDGCVLIGTASLARIFVAKRSRPSGA